MRIDRPTRAPTRRRLVLASASPRRRALLAAAGCAFEVVPADVDESAPDCTSAEDVAMTIALRKARAVAGVRPDAVVLGADTVVVAATGELLGKPTDAGDATRMLRLLAGSTQRVITGVALVEADADGATCEETFAVTTEVTMRPLSAAEIADYVASGEPFGKAGGYAIQETADRFVRGIVGSFDNVVGLPLSEVLARLAARRCGASA